jgi:hypothetical protein
MMSARTDTIDFYRGFGARIRTARIASGLSVQEAADAIGVSVRRFMRFESGQPFRGGHFALSIFARRPPVETVSRGAGVALARLDGFGTR